MLTTTKISAACLLAAFAAYAGGRACAQSGAPVPNAPYDPSVAYSGPDANVLQYDPIDSLAYVNANANSVQYSDRLHGPFNIGVDVQGSYADNIFNASSGATSGGYFSAGVPVGYRWNGNDSMLLINYRIDGYIYPGNSSVNSYSQSYVQQWEKNLSTRTNVFWSLAAGRVTDLGQYLPTIIPIGGIGVTTPTAGDAVAENSYVVTNAVTVLGFTHEVSPRDMVHGSATGGWLEDSQLELIAGQARQVSRAEPAGADIEWDHLATPKSAFGAQVTDLFIRGLAPVGHGNYVAAEGTFKHNFSSYLGVRAAAGPLFVSETGQGIKSNEVSYAASAAVDYTRVYSRFSLDYSRIVELQYEDAPTTANQISLILDRSLGRNYDLTVAGRFIHDNSSNVALQETYYGVNCRLDRYIANNFTLYIEAARFQRANATVPSQPDLSFSRDEASIGLHYQFGSPLERQGARK